MPAHWPLEDIRLRARCWAARGSSRSIPAANELRARPVPPAVSGQGAPPRISRPTASRGCRSANPSAIPGWPRRALFWLDGPVHALHLLLTQIAEAVAMLGDHEVVPHLLEAAETRCGRSTGPRRAATTSRASAGGERQQKIWQLPELIEAPPGLSDAQRESVAAAHRGPHGAAQAAAGDLSAARQDRAHRPRPYRSRLALALRRDAPEDAPHFPHRADAHRAVAGLPLQPVDRALLRADRSGRSSAVCTHPAAVASGQWETIGGMWVEPDTNMPTGEVAGAADALRPALFRAHVRRAP